MICLKFEDTRLTVRSSDRPSYEAMSNRRHLFSCRLAGEDQSSAALYQGEGACCILTIEQHRVSEIVDDPLVILTADFTNARKKPLLRTS